MSETGRLYDSTPAEIPQSSLEYVDQTEAMVGAVLRKDRTVTAG